MRVLMFGWEFAPVVAGGLGVVCRSLSHNLANNGVDVTFVLPKIPRAVHEEKLTIVNASESEVDVSSVEYIEVESLLSPYLNVADFEKMSKELKEKPSQESSSEMYGADLSGEVLKFAVRALDIARKVKHDVIHAHDWMTFKAAANAKSVSGKPLVVHIHATEFERTADNPDPIIYEYERSGMEVADKVIAVSEKTKKKIAYHYGIPRKKIEVVHNAVDESKKVKTKPILTPGLKRVVPTVLFLARLAPSKGADFLLRAAKKVLSINKDVQFVFVGKGSMKEELVDLSLELGINGNVIFPGFLENSRVDRAYRQADLFVMPSIAEPFGITALEAMRNGTPVLMSKQSGASEVVRNALKVDFWDIDEMANKILAVLNHSSLAKTLSEYGYHDLQKMDWDTQSKKVIGIYTALAHDF
ncbi:MAG: glycosyltransferase family 4 protein [Candidatus Dojkabacteria bacterium]